MCISAANTTSRIFPRNQLSIALHSALLSILACSAAAHAEDDLLQLAPTSVIAPQDAGADLTDTSYKGKETRAAAGLPLAIEDTPQTVTLFTRKRMRDQNLTSVSSVLSNTPGISVKEYDSARQYFFARGFEVSNLLIDGSPTLFDPGWGTGETDANTDLYQQVEVVKGASGLTTGAGSPSAAVNLVRKRADSNEFKGAAALGIGNRNQRNGSLDIASPLNQANTIRVRAVLSHNQEDSFRDVGDSARSLAYLTTEFDLSDNTLLTLGGSYQTNDNNAPTWGGTPAWYADGTRSNYGRSKTTAADWAYWDTTHENLFAELRHQLTDNWQLDARYNRGRSDSESRLLYVLGNADRETGLGILPYAGGSFDSTSGYDTYDLAVSGSFGLLDRSHDLTLGLIRSERDFTAHSANAVGVAPIGNFNEWDGKGYPEHVWGDSFLYEKFTDTQNAAYGALRLSLTDRFTTILGTRITNQEIDHREAAYNTAQVVKHSGIVTPYVGLLYDLSDTYTAYASYTDIFTPQQERSASGQTLDPILGKAYEVGIKAGYLGDRLVATAAVFRIEQDNLAVEDGANTIPGSADQAYREAEGATSEGYELELTGNVREGWDVQAGWTAYQLRDAQGEKVVTTQPRRILKAFTTYQLPGALNRITVGGGVSWESEAYALASNPASGAPVRVEQDAYALVNLMAKYQITEQLSAQVNVDNLTDEAYYSNIGTFGQIAYGRPRTLSLTTHYAF